MDFGYVLRRAWQIIWKFKILWVFGILASCGQNATSNGSNSGFRFSGNQTNAQTQIERWFSQLDPGTITLLVVIGVIVALILVVLSILLGTVGRIGLIRGTLKAEQGAERLTFSELWRDGLAYFWRVFGLNLLIGLIIFGVVMILFIPMIFLTVISAGLFVLCLIPLICVFIPVVWAVTVIVEQANIALVVENVGITEAIGRGWKVVRDNLGNMIVMSLILVIGVGLIGAILIGLPLLVVFAPVWIGYANGAAQAIRNGWIITGILFLIYLPILLALSGTLKSYTESAWTLTYMRLAHKPMTQLIETPGVPGDIIPPPA